MSDQVADPVSQQVGQRLRDVRTEKQFSMADVATLTGNEFKPSILGAYERGERVISVPRLVRLAEVYGTRPQFLLTGIAA